MSRKNQAHVAIPTKETVVIRVSKPAHDRLTYAAAALEATLTDLATAAILETVPEPTLDVERYAQVGEAVSNLQSFYQQDVVTEEARSRQRQD